MLSIEYTVVDGTNIMNIKRNKIIISDFVKKKLESMERPSSLDCEAARPLYGVEEEKPSPRPPPKAGLF